MPTYSIPCSDPDHASRSALPGWSDVVWTMDAPPSAEQLAGKLCWACANAHGLIPPPPPPPDPPYLLKTADFVASATRLYHVDTTAGDVTVTLEQPSTANAGQTIELKKIAAPHNMTLACSALIDGVASESFAAQWVSIIVRSTGTTWDVI